MKKNRISIRITGRNNIHTRISIWVNDALICSPSAICLRNEEIYDFIQRLTPNNINIDIEGGRIVKDIKINDLKEFLEKDSKNRILLDKKLKS